MTDKNEQHDPHAWKLNPSAEDYIEVLDALRDEARAGRLRALTIMLQKGKDTDKAIIDSYGTPECVEISCRKTVEKIAVLAARTNVALGNAIANGLAIAQSGVSK